MGGAAVAGRSFVAAATANAHGLAQAALLAVLIAGGIAIYGLLLGLFGVDRLERRRSTTCAT